MTLTLKQSICIVVVAAGLVLASLTAHGSMSIGVGFATGRAGFGVSTYAPLYVSDHIYRSSPTVYHQGAIAIRPAQGKLRKTPRSMYRTPRAIVPNRPPGIHNSPDFRYRRPYSRGYRNPGYRSDYGWPGYGRPGYDRPGYDRPGYDGYYSAPRRKDWEPRKPFIPRDQERLFDQRYDRHFSTPYSPPAVRPPNPYRDTLPPLPYRSPYRNRPGAYGRFYIQP